MIEEFDVLEKCLDETAGKTRAPTMSRSKLKTLGISSGPSRKAAPEASGSGSRELSAKSEIEKFGRELNAYSSLEVEATELIEFFLDRFDPGRPGEHEDAMELAVKGKKFAQHKMRALLEMLSTLPPSTVRETYVLHLIATKIGNDIACLEPEHVCKQDRDLLLHLQTSVNYGFAQATGLTPSDLGMAGFADDGTKAFSPLPAYQAAIRRLRSDWKKMLGHKPLDAR